MMLTTIIIRIGCWGEDDDNQNYEEDDDEDADVIDLCFKLALVWFTWSPLHSVRVNHPLEVFPAHVNNYHGDDGDDDDDND